MLRLFSSLGRNGHVGVVNSKSLLRLSCSNLTLNAHKTNKIPPKKRIYYLNRNSYKGSLAPKKLIMSTEQTQQTEQTEGTAKSIIAQVSSTGATESITPAKKRIYKPIVWIDCEMTGLDHHNDYIIEICCIITDGNLKIVDEEGYESVVHCPKSVMDKMGEWCIEHHGASGLTEKVINSDKTKEQVDNELLEYIKKYIPDPRVGILAGNSVHVDRLFMLKDLPKVVEHLTYRIIDVSSIMEVCRRHNSELSSVMPRKQAAHTAKLDILESIEQLKYYTANYLKNPSETKDFVSKRKLEIEELEKVEASKETSLKRPNEEEEKEVLEPTETKKVKN